MPYEVKYQPEIPPRSRPWKIWNLDKKRIVGTSVTKKDALASVRARGMHSRG